MADVKSLPDRAEPALTIERSPYGGFTIWAATGGLEPGFQRQPLYSCSELNEAFQWMRSAMEGKWATGAEASGD